MTRVGGAAKSHVVSFPDAKCQRPNHTIVIAQEHLREESALGSSTAGLGSADFEGTEPSTSGRQVEATKADFVSRPYPGEGAEVSHPRFNGDADPWAVGFPEAIRWLVRALCGRGAELAEVMASASGAGVRELGNRHQG
ncbi:hypothetical protein L3X38_045493 [Prunus dulcis]|uniref:Uncharacterized protein n=1 Tax=Prunus dulcis TaxID=3755 RepID=A0AAD4UNZ6_PRUDU|nr:hypothetical protein L3X38_045493 [Prunus dulcis]